MSESEIQATLPLVKLTCDDALEIEPVIIWKASEYEKYLKPAAQKLFHDYIENCVSPINARTVIKNKVEDICLDRIPFENITCISLDKQYSVHFNDYQKNDIIYDVIHLLCFLSNTHGVCDIRMQNINNLDAYRQLRLTNNKTLSKRENWGASSWFFCNIRLQAELSTFDKGLLNCFGKILLTKFLTANPRWARRIIRAIEHFDYIFVGRDRVYQIDYINQPNDVVFLSMALESLIDVHFASPDMRDTTKKFIYTLSNIINLKYEEPQKLFNQYLDEFYNLRSRIVHGDEIPTMMFKGNPHIDISYIELGMRIFIYSLKWQLSSHACLEPKYSDLWLSSTEDIHRYFWTKKALLKEILRLFLQVLEKKEDIRHKLDEVTEWVELARIYISLFYDRNDLKMNTGKVDAQEIEKDISQIVYLRDQEVTYFGKRRKLKDLDDIKINHQSTTEEFVCALQQEIDCN